MNRDHTRLLLDIMEAVPPDALRRNRVGLLARMHGHLLAEAAFGVDDVGEVPFATALCLYGELTGAEWIRPTSIPHSDLLVASAMLGPLAQPESLHRLLVRRLEDAFAAGE
ncbi:hypothetical protein SAQ01S_26070 [Sphingomonas aquatilis NBRC 16722]|uniref:DUF2470 domain-containing protein n=1 Tax=Sphingomonas aquatilis TaxID=93063 RepID=A0AAW3TTJ5_9SPHN|nr:hypothetical protein [Sphingomonas aquatilis]MBB3877003.1 hypothetical protein [Sphingomonas aquatilis]GEM72841.1 hypothetical protein SAQ01S_26070 [Sphingomonas aquatilis NBRC 16722]